MPTLEELRGPKQDEASQKLAEELGILSDDRELLDIYFDNSGETGKLMESLCRIQKSVLQSSREGSSYAIDRSLFQYKEFLAPLRYFLLFLPKEHEQDLKDIEGLFQSIRNRFTKIDFQIKGGLGEQKEQIPMEQDPAIGVDEDDRVVNAMIKEFFYRLRFIFRQV